MTPTADARVPVLCPDCLVDQPRDARFCSSCGRPLSTPANGPHPAATGSRTADASAACRFCGGTKPEHAVVCDSCRELVMADPEIEELFGAAAGPAPSTSAVAVPLHDTYPDVTESESLPFASATSAADDPAEPHFESWWVPPVAPPARVPTHSTAVRAAIEESVAMAGTGPMLASGTPKLESWWVPTPPKPAVGGNAAVAMAVDLEPLDDDPARPMLAIVPPSRHAEPESAIDAVPPSPTLRLVSPVADDAVIAGVEPDDAPLFAGPPEVRSAHGGTFRVAPEDSSAAALESAWMGSESEAAPLPQPWWSPRQATDTEMSPAAPTPTVATPTVSPAPSPDAIAKPVAPVVMEADTRPTVAAPSRPAAAVARPAPAATPRQASARPTARTTRPAFLMAGFVAILLGGGYAVYSYMYAPPTTSVADPQRPVPEAVPAAAPAGPLADVAPLATPGDTAPPTQGDINVTVVGLAPKPAPAGRPTKKPATASRAGVKPVANRRTPLETPAPEPVAALALTPSTALPTGVAMVPAAAMTTTPTALQMPTETFEAAAVDVKPEITRKIEPRYPDAARERGLEDVVIVRVLVSPNGHAADTRLLRRSKVDPSFDDAAVAAVRQWGFSPARKRDRAVACWLNVGVPFRGARQLESR